MALLRMTALALVACRAAAADPSASPEDRAGSPAGSAATAAHAAAPAGWIQLPAVAEVVATAARTDGAATSVAVDAWGEPAAGCYALWLELHGAAGDAPALADRVLGGIAGLTLGELVKPAGPEGVLAFAFARPPYRGHLRAQLGAGRIAAAACFGNPRESLACDTTCARVLQDVR